MTPLSLDRVHSSRFASIHQTAGVYMLSSAVVDVLRIQCQPQDRYIKPVGGGGGVAASTVLIEVS